ncbi:unnamed protein product [Prorocentrum cordatum]|uniref:GAF domain-containing protein n=1 Tax=Prorocentrum cordatum TaxID=2364126 RepID=A0ABN9TNN1_9DINO|nr:unnamed protein product [Polarella glacialis]
MGQGIAGYVFEHLEAVSIPDCYKDPRFDCSFDRASGYTTRSLLAAPILDYEGSCVGVLQAINKVGPHDKAVFDPMPIGMRAVPFRRNDEKMLLHLTQHVGIALRNSEVYREAISSSERATGLLNTIQGLSQDLGIQSMLLTITMHAGQIVSCERSTVFLLDEAKGELWSVSTDTGQEIRIPKTTGLAGECCSEGKLINIPDAYADSRFNQDVDKRTGFKTQSILAIPMLTAGGDVLGVIQMINKVSPDGAYEVFDEADVAVMELFAKFVGPRLTQSPALVPQAARRPPPSEAALALSPGARAPGPAPQPRRSGCRAEAMGPLQERTRSTRARWAAAERPTARRTPGVDKLQRPGLSATGPKGRTFPLGGCVVPAWRAAGSCQRERGPGLFFFLLARRDRQLHSRPAPPCLGLAGLWWGQVRRKVYACAALSSSTTRPARAWALRGALQRPRHPTAASMPASSQGSPAGSRADLPSPCLRLPRLPAGGAWRRSRLLALERARRGGLPSREGARGGRAPRSAGREVRGGGLALWRSRPLASPTIGRACAFAAVGPLCSLPVSTSPPPRGTGCREPALPWRCRQWPRTLAAWSARWPPLRRRARHPHLFPSPVGIGTFWFPHPLPCRSERRLSWAARFSRGACAPLARESSLISPRLA